LSLLEAVAGPRQDGPTVDTHPDGARNSEVKKMAMKPTQKPPMSKQQPCGKPTPSTPTTKGATTPTTGPAKERDTTTKR
jgi:hypothetical protein